MTALSEEDFLVLDIGSVYCKAGIGGEAKPRLVLPYNTAFLLEGDSYDFRKYRTEDFQVLADYRPDGGVEKLKILVKKLLVEIFFRHLNVNPAEKRIVFIENPFTPIYFKQILSEILFKKFKIKSITFILSHIAAISTLGKTNGIIVECGYKETTIIPIYNNRPCLFYVEIVSLSGNLLDELIWRFLMSDACAVQDENGQHMPFRDLKESFENNRFLIERIKCTACSFDDAHDDIDDTLAIDYKDGLMLSLSVRALNQQVTCVLAGCDDDNNSIANAICDAVFKCPRDVRRAIIANIAVVGGCGAIAGFAATLLAQIKLLLKTSPKYAPIKQLAAEAQLAPLRFPPPYAAWIGGSLTGRFKHRAEYTRENFANLDRIPDWSSYTYAE